jgi:type IV pilus secretin PilQ/predicted competence protein
MNRYLHRLVLAVASLSLVLPGAGLQAPSPLASLAKLSLVPSRVSVKIVLEPATAVPDLKAAYAKDNPSELVLDLGRIQPPAAPAMPAGEALVRDIKVQPGADSRVSLLVFLKEPVPYRISAESGRTVVELMRILDPDDYALAPEAQAALDQSKDSDAAVTVDVANRSDRTDVTARLGRKAVTNVFALANPLRLVVDIYGAVLGTPTKTHRIGNSGVEQIKVGQFQTAPPRAVTRVVFELAEARPYTLVNTAVGLTVSFLKDAASAGDPPANASAPNDITSAPLAALKRADPAPVLASAASSPVPAAKSAAVDPPPAQIKPEKRADEPAAKDDKSKAKTIHDTQEKYSGAMISPKFLDADLKQVILWLCEFAGLNVVFDPEVRGTVTISLDSVPWDQFLDLILKINNQGKTLEGNVLRIAPVTKLAAEEKDQQTFRDAKEQSGPMTTKIFTLSYAKSKDVVELLKNKKSGRGEIVTDDRTNTVIVTDVKEKLDLMESLIGTLDTATPQVQIETRIVEATSTFAQSLGVQWGAKGIADPFYGNQTSLQFPNKILVDGAMIPQGIVTKGIGGPLGGYAVNLPAPAFNSALSLSFANALDTFRLDVALSALESSGEGKIQSTERITTQNNKEGYVNQGRQIPVQTSANFTVTTQYVNAGLELRVTPQITAEGTVIMTIDIKNDAADFSNLVNGIPPITTQSAKTTVTVADGGTTVIGGVYRIEDSITRDRVPFLHQIPILGNLFKSFSKTKSNREILIFITPRIQK